VLGVIVVAGILSGVLVALHHKHQNSFKLKETSAIAAFTARLQAILPQGQDASFVQPDLYAFYPSFTTDIQDLESGKLSASDATAKGKAMGTSAQKAATAISSLNVTRLVPSSFSVTGWTSTDAGAGPITAPGATQQVLLEGQFQMSQAFQTWQQAASIFQAAADAPKAQQKALADQANQLATKAASLWDRGYLALINVRKALGLTTLNAPATSFTPSPSPIPTPPPTPSASASG
jgi:hypothetical protein